MKKILLATNNRHKLSEFREYFSGLNIEIVTPRDLNLEFSVEENGLSFAENSKIKSKALFELSGYPSIADDSGLCVEALGGEPGIYSARFGGSDLSDQDRAELVLNKMIGISNRNAWFECVISLTDKNGTLFFSGKCAGEITNDYDKGGSAFGYDPIFFYPPMQERFSRLPLQEKNRISHRGRALEKLKEFLLSSASLTF